MYQYKSYYYHECTNYHNNHLSALRIISVATTIDTTKNGRAVVKANAPLDHAIPVSVNNKTHAIKHVSIQPLLAFLIKFIAIS